MIIIKNNIVGLFIISVVISKSLCFAVDVSENDMFYVMKNYVEQTANKTYSEDIVIVDEGEDMEDILSQKINEKYLIALENKIYNDSIKDEVISGDSESGYGDEDVIVDTSVSVDKYPNQDLYFAGTTDFTNLSTSKKDSVINCWSAINSKYDSYDDNGEDNITIIATAYTSAAEENGGYEGMNAIGGKLGPGCIAAPKDIPFQTKIRISGLGVFNVEDRGGAIVRVSNDVIRIDVWMGSYREAMKFGKRVYKGRILT